MSSTASADRQNHPVVRLPIDYLFEQSSFDVGVPWPAHPLFQLGAHTRYRYRYRVRLGELAVLGETHLEVHTKRGIEVGIVRSIVAAAALASSERALQSGFRNVKARAQVEDAREIVPG
jgi:hypothetical protein